MPTDAIHCYFFGVTACKRSVQTAMRTAAMYVGAKLGFVPIQKAPGNNVPNLSQKGFYRSFHSEGKYKIIEREKNSPRSMEDRLSTASSSADTTPGNREEWKLCRGCGIEPSFGAERAQTPQICMVLKDLPI